MVLAYRGKDHSETALASAFRSAPLLGTQAENAVSGLEQLGYRALWFQNATLEKLLSLLAADWPVIIFVYAADLPHGLGGIHALVVIGIEDEKVLCLDPELSRDLSIEMAEFQRIWAGLDNQGLVIWE